jgi:hypothetical protein
MIAADWRAASFSPGMTIFCAPWRPFETKFLYKKRAVSRGIGIQRADLQQKQLRHGCPWGNDGAKSICNMSDRSL